MFVERGECTLSYNSILSGFQRTRIEGDIVNSSGVPGGGGGGGGGYSPKFRIGVCRERFQTLTLSKDKENEN